MSDLPVIVTTDLLMRAALAGRRATLDPGAFVRRGPDYDGNPYEERLDQWQDRALKVAVEELLED